MENINPFAVESANDAEQSFTWLETFSAVEEPVFRAASLGVLTSGPDNGYGPATFQPVTIHADGTWNATGAVETVVIPLLK